MKVNRIQSNAHFSYLNSELIFLKSTNKKEGEQNKVTAKIILIATFQGYNSPLNHMRTIKENHKKESFDQNKIIVMRKNLLSFYFLL